MTLFPSCLFPLPLVLVFLLSAVAQAIPTASELLMKEVTTRLATAELTGDEAAGFQKALLGSEEWQPAYSLSWQRGAHLVLWIELGLACSQYQGAGRCPGTRKSADTFAEASALASKEGAPIVIYVHGSSWHPASRLFGEKIWSSAEFRSTLPDGVVLTDIHLKQLLDEEAAKAQAKELEGWNRKTIRTFPALQVFGADGHLLKTVQGREMREIISPAILSKIVQEALVSMAQRKDLLAEIEAARQKKDAEKELEALIRLVKQAKLSEAWVLFEEAKATDPEGPNGKAMWRYGVRVAGLPLRATLPKGSSLNGKELGENLSRGHASFTMSSSQHDNPEFHSSLFGGPFAPSGFAFHTGSEKDAHIVIDLQGECEIRALLVTNRASSKERAESLTLGSSSDGKEWQTQWQAGEVLPFWGIHLETPVKARFLKLGLDRKTPEFFHLTAVDIYGKRS